jgi:hypothetical protein
MRSHLVIFLPVGGGLEKRKDRLIGLSFIIIFCLIIFSGCATKEAVRKESEERLRQRVATYWTYKMKQEQDKMYPLESPFYRKTVRLTTYVKRSDNPLVDYKTFDILEIDMKDDNADVKMVVKERIIVPGSKPFEYDMALTEQWVRIDGEWYHIFGNKQLTR